MFCHAPRACFELFPCERAGNRRPVRRTLPFVTFPGGRIEADPNRDAEQTTPVSSRPSPSVSRGPIMHGHDETREFHPGVHSRPPIRHCVRIIYTRRVERRTRVRARERPGRRVTERRAVASQRRLYRNALCARMQRERAPAGAEQFFSLSLS